MKVFYLLKRGLLLLCFFTVLKVQAQTGIISGKVLDETGLPLPGASVFIKGTSKFVSTDNEGLFKFAAVPNGDVVLQVRFIGHKTLERAIKLTGNIQLTFTLESDNQLLDDIVIIGYGTQTKRELTGAIAKVSGEKLTSLPTPSFEASLQGQAPGIQVTQGSGLAGSGSVIRIRGIGSISAAGDPLYVLDGIPITSDPFIAGNRGAMNQNPLATINPNDIESVEILKDAAAAGIYGSRGANGVILITTKRGKSGKPRITLSSKYGLSTYANKPTFATGAEWLSLRQEAWTNDGNTGLAPLPGGLTWAEAQQNNTDWWGIVTETGKSNDQSLSVSYGTEKVSTYVSASYGDNHSFLKGNSYERYGVRANVDVRPTSFLTASVNVGYDKGTNNRVNAAWSGGLGDAMSTALPIFPVYNADGTFFSNGANPARNIGLLDWKTINERLVGGVTLELKPVKNLSIKGIANIDHLDINDNVFTPAELRNAARGYSSTYPTKVYNRTLTGTVNYDWQLNPEHKLAFMAGAEAQYADKTLYRDGIFGEADGPFNKDRESYYAAIAAMEAGGGLNYYTGFDRDTFASLFGRINYSYKNKFYLQGVFRRDGSSKFGPQNKFGYFPSGSASWYINQEEFLKDSETISNLKLRVSYGLVGSAGFSPGQYFQQFQYSGSYNGQPVLYPVNVENPALKWEAGRNMDVGLDFGLFKGRINGEIAYYRKKTTEPLISGSVSPSTGFANGFINVGRILNEGIELGLNTINIQSENFKWTTRLNASKNYNEVLSLGDLTPDAIGGGTNDTRIAVGYPIGTNYLVRYKGVDPADGLPIWLDKEGYETKTFSLDNRVPVGKILPDYVGGLTNTFNYKGFELNTLFTFAIGGNLYDGSAKRQLGVVTDWNIREDIADRWREPGDIAKYPRLTMNSGNYPGLSSEWQYNSTMFLYDATFVRLREVTLAYTFPTKVATKLRLQNLRIFATGMNLLTFSKYPGGDPEIARDFENPQDRNMSPNVTYLTTPQQKSITFGLTTSF